MAQQQQPRREDVQFQNRNEDQRKNSDEMFGTEIAVDPVGAYAAAGYGVPAGTTTTTRYDYTAVYGTVPAPAPGFVDPAVVGAGGGGQWGGGQEANADQGAAAGGGGNTGGNMNIGGYQK